MDILIKFLTKNRVLLFSDLGLILYIVSYFSQSIDLPDRYKDFCCLDDVRLNLFLIFLPIFLFSFVFIYLSDSKFTSWKNFSLAYLVFYVILYFLVPTQGDGFLWFQRETISIIGSVLYTFISLILIIYKSFKKEAI